MEKILRKKKGWDVFPLPSPLVEHREPKLLPFVEWQLEKAELEEKADDNAD